MEVEICCFSLESVLELTDLPIHRIELCGGMLEGGTTPSTGLLDSCLAATTIPIYVMIRPRGGDFIYSKAERKVIFADLKHVLKSNPAGIVFGALNEKDEVDKNLCAEFIDACEGKPVTFHRAFDASRDPIEALEIIMELGFERILSSGGEPTAIEGLEVLQKVKKKAGQKIEIMAGSGVKPYQVDVFQSIQLDAVHSTAKRWIKSVSKDFLAMVNDPLPDPLGKYEVDGSVVKAFIQKIS